MRIEIGRKWKLETKKDLIKAVEFNGYSNPTEYFNECARKLINSFRSGRMLNERD